MNMAVNYLGEPKHKRNSLEGKGDCLGLLFVNF